MNKSEVDKYRTDIHSRLEELTVMGAKQNSDLFHIKESVDEVKVLVKEQNGRVRVLESSVSRMQGIGSMVTVVFGSLIGWLFKGE
jgi:uncharacterized membrane protein|tara:strand:+ start:537 stop:791 length:255 start_codon:yes stop_codon:yes gene_type:complete